MMVIQVASGERVLTICLV